MKVAIYGAGGHGHVTLDLLRSMGEHEVVGFLDDDAKKHGQDLYGFPVLGGKTLLTRGTKPLPFQAIVLALANGKLRQALAELCAQEQWPLLGVRHPHATLSKNAELHPSVAIWPQAVVHVGARLGQEVIVNTGAIVEHDVQVGDFSFIAPGAVICGYAQIGKRAWIGAGAVVLQSVRIGDDATIGAGSVVTKDIPNGVTAFGVPCEIR